MYAHLRCKPNFASDNVFDTPPPIEARRLTWAMGQVMQTAPQLPDTTVTFNRWSASLTAEAQVHRRWCKSLPQVQPGVAERLIADFVATKGVTTCPTRYAAPIEQLSQLVRHTH
jgi:hypothetical protein